ncbi:hypothetical protein FHR22_000102 [Sphingopyxis panaciterrae]|nr:hypothetical protein [Sphingopyxis panaciterrae]
MLELGLGDWTRDTQGPVRTDTVQLGDALVRVGLTDSLEAQLGWTAYGHVRVRDRTAGAVDKVSGVGDVTIALRQNLRNPDGSGFSIALMPYASLPAGGRAIGAGDWATGLLVPMSLDLSDSVSLGVTPQVDAAADGDGNGRHLGFGTVVGLGVGLSDSLSAAGEVSLYRDRDPAGRSTEALAGLSMGWQPGKDMQLDLGVNLGLNRASPDAEVYFGIVRRF